MVKVSRLCADFLSGLFAEGGVPTIIIVWSISPFRSVSICLIYLGSAVLGADTFTVVIYFDELIPLSLCNNFVSCYHIPLKVYFV